MAGETTTTSANDLFQTDMVGPRIIVEVRPHMVSRPFFRFQGKLPTNTFRFTLQDDPGAAAATAEAVSLANTSLTTSDASATAGTVGMMATVTDEETAVSLVAALPLFSGQLTRSVGEKYETDFTALMDDFTNVTGTSGADYTLSQMLEAKGALANRDAIGQLVQVVHPQQWNDLEQDMATTTAGYFANPQAKINGLDAASLSGFAGAPWGIPTYQTSLIPTADTGANRHGAMFVSDVALGLYEIWGTRVELQRDASLPGTEIVVTARYGVVEIRDTWGQGVKTDA